ncbi:MAG: hypothetical protein WAT71_13705 [Ignavibacteria bacterium]
MSIPELNQYGHLPEGIYDCSIEELEERFGKFQSSDIRVKLFNSLISYVEELKNTEIGKYLIIDGSFTTNKERPEDIDLLLVLKDEIQLEEIVPPFKYNVRSKKYIKKHYPFDFYFGYEDDDSSIKIINLFYKVKDSTLRKGFLKIKL